MSNKEVLNRAADLVEIGWTQFVPARNACGKRVSPEHSSAREWCATGAVRKAVKEIGSCVVDEWVALENKCLDALKRAIRDEPTGWNDDPNRTQAEIADALRKAARAPVENAEAAA